MHFSVISEQAKPELRLHGLRARLRREIAITLRQLPTPRLYSAEYTATSAVWSQKPVGQQLLHVPKIRPAACLAA